MSLLKQINKNFFVINGDIVTNLNFKNMIAHHEQVNATVTMAIKKAGFKVPYGVVLNKFGKVTSIEEKPIVNYNINCGIYIMSPSVVRDIKKTNEYLDMPNLLKKIIKAEGEVSAFSLYESWHDVADLSDLKKVREETIFN